MADGVTEQRFRPLQFADQLLGVRVDQQLVVVETMTILRIVRAVHAIAVDLARVRIRQIAVVNLVCVFRKFDALQFDFASGVEQAQLYLGGVCREQGEVDAQAIPACTERKGKSFTNARRGTARVV